MQGTMSHTMRAVESSDAESYDDSYQLDYSDSLTLSWAEYHAGCDDLL